MRRAKIVATLGPSLDDRDTLRAALEAGIDVVRLNFSHGTHDDHVRRLEMVRELAVELGRNIGSLADLQGPKIRLGTLPPEGLELVTGSEVFLQPGAEELASYESGGQVALPVVYEALADDVDEGALILVADGSIRLLVTRVADGGVWARVIAGGQASSKKGVNLPGVEVSAASLTEKDVEDLGAAVDMGVDWLALSFVRKPEDPETARRLVGELDGDTPIVSKLERPEAVERLGELVEASDAVMVARGDLGVEIGPERVPAIQKEIIYRANAAAKPVITATEMLESMITSPRATRAEASDVANAIFDGTDAVMLSGETAAGRYPVEAVRTMAQIIEVAESSPHLVHPRPEWRGPNTETKVARVVAEAAVQVASDVGARAIVVYSISGASIQVVSTFRPPSPLLGLTPVESTRARTALMWGAEAALVPLKEQQADLFATAERVLLDGKWVQHGDKVVIVSGRPGGAGSTNRIMVHRIGDPVQV